MTVRNINSLDLCKRLFNHCHIRSLRNHPHTMFDAVLTDKIVYRCLCFDLSDLVLQFLFRPICQENGPRLHTAGIYMADTVFLLIRSGIFMLFDHIVPVIVNRGTSHYTGLAVPVHGQFIQIETWRRILYKFSFLNFLPKQLIRFLIHTVRICVYFLAKLRLRPINRQKRVRILLHHFTRFLPVIYIIRKRRNPFLHPLTGTICPKWSDLCHTPTSQFLYVLILPNPISYHKVIKISKQPRMGVRISRP